MGAAPPDEETTATGSSSSGEEDFACDDHEELQKAYVPAKFPARSAVGRVSPPVLGRWPLGTLLKPVVGEPAAPAVVGPDEITKLRQSTTAIDFDRVFVWRSDDWHPIPEAQNVQVKKRLETGQSVFDVRDGPYMWTIDTTGPDGWVQISKTTGRKRALKCQLQSTPRLQAVAHNRSVGVSSGSQVAPTTERRQFPSVRFQASGRVAVPKGDEALNPDAFEVGGVDPPVEVPKLVDVLRQEWAALAKYASKVVFKRSGMCKSLTKEDLMKAWMQSLGKPGAQYNDLISQSIADTFLKIDLNQNGLIEEVEWMHFWMLQEQSPSFAALSQVNELLVEFLKEDPEVLERLHRLFVGTCGAHQDARLTASQLRIAAKEWLAEMKLRYNHNQVADYLEDLLASEIPLDADELFSYYDFMNHVLGRRKVKVQLYQYDLSKGGAKWLSPLLVGKRLDGLWHTSLVVYGHEYWYGGAVFQSTPGNTTFGAPSNIIDLPAQTMRTHGDFVKFLSRVLAHEFTSDSYDILSCNCNHFTDAASLFLLNSHIPEDVMTQPDVVMGTWTMQLLRPVLNRALGRFESSDTMSEVEPTALDMSTFADNAASIWPGTLVVWEHNEGWTRIARVLSWCVANRSGCLHWIDTHTGEMHTEAWVPRSRIQRLEECIDVKRNRAPDSMVGGMFGARYHVLDAPSQLLTPNSQPLPLSISV